MAIIRSKLNRFSKKVFTVNLAKNLLLKIPPNLAYVATLPCKTLMSAKQATSD